MSCNSCGGQIVVARDLAEALAEAFGPRRRDNNRVSQYGGKGIIKYNPTVSETISGIKESVTLVDWSSHDRMPRPVTVEVGRIAAGGAGSFPAGTDADGNALGYRPYAQVTIGLPATMQDPFFLDVGRGQKFTATASYLAVTLLMGVPPAGRGSGSMAVYGSLGEGTSPTLAPVLRTVYIDALPASGGSNTQIIEIPPRANFLLPVRCSATDNITTIDVMDNAGIIIDSFTFANGQMITPAELPDDAFQIMVTNGGPLLADYRLIFQLSV